MNSEDQRFDPLVRCYLVHYQFEAIHPFRDGNGRVGRSLLALMTYKWLDHAMPWLYMSSFFEEFRDEYVDNLFAISTAGNWEKWIEYCLRGTIVQAKDSVRRCNAFNVLRSQLHERIKFPSPRSHKIVEGLFSSPVVTVPSLATQFDIAYPTARIDIDKLLEAGILAESADTHPKSFFAPEILAIAYGDTISVSSETELSGDKE